jgi:ABC-2 type transport system permease protein
VSATGIEAGTGRLSLLKAAYVMARRDFVAILWSRAFLFFLLGPLFPLIVGGLAGNIGSQVRESMDVPELGVMLDTEEIAALQQARERVAGELGLPVPVLRPLDAATGDPRTALGRVENLGAVLTGSLAEPRLIGTEGQIASWRGGIALLVETATRGTAGQTVELTLEPVADPSGSDLKRAKLLIAQGAQVLLFLLSMLLAGMVLSNLVEEKGNKIIEVLAAAIPMDAVFLGKLFAMLAISLVGMTVWAGAGGVIVLAFLDLSVLPPPALGWPAFLALFVVYFSMNYLLVGSLFLAIGSLATTVREVQTISMPVTMSQVLIFFLAGLAIAQPGETIDIAATVFPLSSPYVLLARAAIEEGWWVHVIGIAWQALFVALFIRGGASLFRRRVMNGGSRGTRRRGGRRFVLPWLQPRPGARTIDTPVS